MKEWEHRSLLYSPDENTCNIVAYRIDDMLNAIQEVTLDAGGLLEQKQDIINMPVGRLLEMFARNNIFIHLDYRKPFKFKLAELRNKENKDG